MKNESEPVLVGTSFKPSQITFNKTAFLKNTIYWHVKNIAWGRGNL
jgi:hypothetical protein